MPHLYVVTRQFEAPNAISGRMRQFKPGEMFGCDAKRNSTGTAITVEVDAAFFLVERSILETCCRIEYVGGPL